MRIIAGIAKGRRLKSTKNNHTRPTADRVKESLFNIIGFSIESTEVLDLFAGTGNLGLEALSRGARAAVFVDKDRECYQIIKDNIESLGFFDKSRVVKGDCLAYIRSCNQKFDYIFMDPPYGLDNINEYILALFNNNILTKTGLIILEHDNTFISDIKPLDRRKYGQTYLSFYKWINYKGV